MKVKPYILVMLSVVVAASCRDHTGIEEDFPIGLSALSSSTRSVIQNINDFNTQGSFGVYGYKSVGSYRQIFIDQEVNYNSTAWEYIPIKYWDRNCYYNFGAYAPYFDDTSSATDPYLSHNSVSSGSDNHVLTVKNFPNWQWVSARYFASDTETFNTSNNQGCKDLQFAFSHDAAQNYITNDAGYVHFTFDHALAWIEIQVSSPSLPDNPTTNFYITDLSIGNDSNYPLTHENCDVPDGNGNFDFNVNYSAETIGFGTPTATGYATLYPVSTGQRLKITKDDQLICSYLCVPFAVTGDGIFLHLSYNTGTSTPVTKKIVAIPLSTTENLKSLEQGKKYTVKLRFEMGEPLKVVKVYVTDWNNGGEENRAFYNW